MAESEFLDAKAYLSKTSTSSGISLYDHLSSVIGKLLDERPNNAVDLLEEVSAQVKKEQFRDKSSTIKDKPEVPTVVALAKTQASLFQDEGRVEEEEPSTPDIVQILSRFQEGGVGLGQMEAFRLALALKKLVAKYQIEEVRFWGKIFGLQKNYLIVEAQYKEGEAPKPAEADDNADSNQNPEDNGDEPQDVLPKSQYKPIPPAPVEENGSGTNKKIYFVCNEVGEEWSLLPDVTPAQIVAAREIKKYFTGVRDAPVVSYPPFPGNEENYLRAQIARISAATHISPLGFYTFDDESEEDEESRTSFIKAEEFEPKTRAELLDPALSGWVHHVQAILPQGRCKWVNTIPPKEPTGDEDEEEEEEGSGPEPEVGPPLLHPLQNDDPVHGQQPWSTKLSSSLNPEYAWVIASSNRWPGAYAYAIGKEFENIYVGWGHKYSADPYSPAQPPAPEAEFPNAAEITEAADPTREEEVAYENALKAAAEEAEAPEGEEEED